MNEPSNQPAKQRAERTQLPARASCCARPLCAEDAPASWSAVPCAGVSGIRRRGRGGAGKCALYIAVKKRLDSEGSDKGISLCPSSSVGRAQDSYFMKFHLVVTGSSPVSGYYFFFALSRVREGWGVTTLARRETNAVSSVNLVRRRNVPPLDGDCRSHLQNL